MLKELFMEKPPASFKDDFFYFSLIFTLSRPWYFLNIITKNPTCLTQLTLGRTRKVIPQATPTVVQVGGGGTPP